MRRPVLRSFALALGAGVLALLALARAARAEEIVVEGKRVVVTTTVPSKAVAERCRDALEAAIVVYEANLPWRMKEGERLVLHVWETAKEYEDAVTEGGAAWLAKNLAATLTKTKESHVVLQPRSDPAYLALVGDLPEMTRFLVCHEGVHQYIRRCGVAAYSHWPAWLSEGMAEELAERCLAAGAPAGAPTPIGVDDSRHRMIDAIARGAGISLERLLHAEPATFTRTFVAYSYWHELYGVLARDPARLTRLLREIGSMGEPGAPGAGARDDRSVVMANACAERLAAVYGPLPKLEEALRGTTLERPVWFEPNRASERRGDEIVCAGFAESNAILISGGAPPGGPFAFSCEVNLADVGGRQADLYFGFADREDPRFVKIALGAGGFASLLAHADGFWQARYRRNADVPPETFACGAWVPVRVTVDRARVRVEAGGAKALEADVPPGFDVLGGSWGIGATDSVARFRKIEVRPLR